MKPIPKIKISCIKTILPVLIITLFSFTSPAQDSNRAIDSLKQVINQCTSTKNSTIQDTIYFNTVIRLTREYHLIREFDSLASYVKTALPHAELAYKNASSSEMKLKMSKVLMIFHKSIGMSLYENSDYPGSVKEFLLYLKFAEEANSIGDQGSALNYIGYNHRELGDIKKALEYNSKAIAVLEKGTNKIQLANAYTGRSTLLDDLDAPVDSILYYNKKSISFCLDAGEFNNAANTTLNIAETYFRIREFDSCKVWTNKMKAYVEKDGTPDLKLRLTSLLGRFEYLNGNIGSSLQYSAKAAAMAREDENPMIVYLTLKYLALSQAAAHNYLQSMNSIDSSFDAYSDDMNGDKVRELNTIQLKNEFEKEKQLQAFEFEKKEALTKEELKRQKLIRNFSLAGILTFLVIAFLLYRLNDKLKKSYVKLQHTQLQLVETEKQREAQNVRVGIARDIHDELGSGLTRITMLSDLAAKKVKTDATSVEQSLKKITEYSKGVSDSLHEIVWAVNPGYDTLEGLSTYMKQYANQFLEDTGISFNLHFDIGPSNFNIDPTSRRNIFLVMKEALNNAAKYSKANKIEVSFKVSDKMFKLEVSDNGTGFSESDTKITSGNGLVNMRKRMEQLGGTCHLTSSPGNGVRVMAEGKFV